MRIKLVHFTASLKIGGAETVLYNLAQNLLPNHFEQTVLYIHDGPYRKKLQELGIPCFQISGYLFRYDPVFFWRVYRILKKLNPDCLHTLLWAANCAGRIAARLLKIPLVCVYHNNVDQDGLLRNLLDRFTLITAQHTATTLVAVSDEVAGSINRAYGFKIPAVRVIKNGVNTLFIQEQSICLKKERSIFGFDPDHVVIGSVGRFEPVKRYDLLLESFAYVHAQLPQTRLFLIGSGSQQAALRDCAANLGLAPFIQFVSDSPTYGYYPVIDIFVQTSDKEGISLALLEAMGTGRACVVTHVGEQHPVITHKKDGLIVPVGDAQELAGVLGRLVQDPAWRKELGTCAQKKVQAEFSQCAMHAAYLQLFSTVGNR